jgi:hypothetical protein
MTNTAPAESRTSPSQVFDCDPIVLHYHLRSDIERSLGTGAAIKSLCGMVGAVGASGSGTQNARTVVCPLCAMVYADLPVGGNQ